MALTDEEKQKIEEEEMFRAEARARSESKTQKKSGSGCSGCLGVIVIGFLAIILIGLLSPKAPPKTPEQIAQEKKSQDDQACNSDNTMAFVMAKEFVEKVLKAPTTASFPWGTSDSQITNIGDCTYLVRSYVDAENSFGAKIRTKYTVKVKYIGNDKWSALDIKLDD